MSDAIDSSNRKARLTVAGSFGYGNAGDEGAPLALADLARTLGYDLSVDVLGRYNKPAMHEVIGLGTKDVARRQAIANQPLLFIGGGVIEPRMQCSLFRIAPWRKEAAVPYSALFAVSVETGCKYGWGMKRRLQSEASSLRHLFVRDVPSRFTLSNMLPGRSVEVIGDSLLYLEPAKQSPAPLRELGERYIAVNLTPRWESDSNWRPWISLSLMKVAHQLDAGIAFVPCTQDYDRDQDEQDAVAAHIRQAGFEKPIVCLGAGYTPREISAAFGGAILTIGMRLHACVLSYARRVPWVAIAYHPKLSGFAATIEQPERVLPSILPDSQSPKMYGYTFSALNLVDCDLERAAMSAVESASFHMIDPLKQRLSNALQMILQDAFSAPSNVVQGVTG